MLIIDLQPKIIKDLCTVQAGIVLKKVLLSAQIRHFFLSVRARATSSHQDSSKVVGINKALLDLLCNITRPLLVLVQPCLLSQLRLELRLQLRTFYGSANLTYKSLTSLDIYSQMPPLSPFINSFRTRLLSLTSSPHASSYHTKYTATMFPLASLPLEIICQVFQSADNFSTVIALSEAAP
jgi:hypothetical protein